MALKKGASDALFSDLNVPHFNNLVANDIVSKAPAQTPAPEPVETETVQQTATHPILPGFDADKEVKKPSKHRQNLYLNEATYRYLAYESRRRGMTITSLVEHILMEYQNSDKAHISDEEIVF